MYTAIQKTWWWQCFNFPAFPLNRISNILSFFFVFPVLTQILQTMIFFTLSLCLGKGKSCLTAALPEHTRMKTSRGVLHPCATAWKLQQEASSCCCWSAGRGGYTASSQAPHWDPLQLPCRQNYIFCTLKEAFHPKPIPLPAPALMGTQNLHTGTMAWCHFGLSLNAHRRFSWAWTSLLCIQILLGPSFTLCWEGAASRTQNRKALPEPPQWRGEHNIPVHDATCSSLGRTVTKCFPLKTFVHQHTQKVNQSLTTAAHTTTTVGRNT